jgi:hypothetical protein
MAFSKGQIFGFGGVALLAVAAGRGGLNFWLNRPSYEKIQGIIEKNGQKQQNGIVACSGEISGRDLIIVIDGSEIIQQEERSFSFVSKGEGGTGADATGKIIIQTKIVPGESGNPKITPLVVVVLETTNRDDIKAIQKIVTSEGATILQQRQAMKQGAVLKEVQGNASKICTNNQNQEPVDLPTLQTLGQRLNQNG